MLEPKGEDWYIYIIKKLYNKKYSKIKLRQLVQTENIFITYKQRIARTDKKQTNKKKPSQ